jgi:hypothetical protein
MGLAATNGTGHFEGPVRIVDLDIVNMYYRSREASEPLAQAGVEVVMPQGNDFWADIPIIVPEVKGALHRTDGIVILDVGGDDMGARVLSHLADEFPKDNYTLTMVVNANRPFTSSIEGARKVLDELECAATLKIGGLISNTHLMDETTPDEIRRGYEFTLEMSKLTSLPIVMIAVENKIINIDEGGTGGSSGVRSSEFDCPLLPLYRFMLPPWRNPELGTIKTSGDEK